MFGKSQQKGATRKRAFGDYENVMEPRQSGGQTGLKSCMRDDSLTFIFTHVIHVIEIQSLGLATGVLWYRTVLFDRRRQCCLRIASSIGEMFGIHSISVWIYGTHYGVVRCCRLLWFCRCWLFGHVGASRFILLLFVILHVAIWLPTDGIFLTLLPNSCSGSINAGWRTFFVLKLLARITTHVCKSLLFLFLLNFTNSTKSDTHTPN